MRRRLLAHEIETQACDLVRSLIDKNAAIYREISGRDYGIDAIVELFDHGEVQEK